MEISSNYLLVIWILKPQRFHFIDTTMAQLEKNHCTCKEEEQVELFYIAEAKHYCHIGTWHLVIATDRYNPKILP